MLFILFRKARLLQDLITSPQHVRVFRIRRRTSRDRDQAFDSTIHLKLKRSGVALAHSTQVFLIMFENRRSSLKPYFQAFFDRFQESNRFLSAQLVGYHSKQRGLGNLLVLE